jgi:HEAT repeat protein
VQLSAAAGLWRIERREESLAFVIAGLKDETWHAADLLGELGPDAAVALDSLRAAARHPDPDVRRAVADAIRVVASVE